MSGEGSVCEACGATIYKEHIDSGIARYEAGKLMCPHCVSEYEKSHDGATGAAVAVEATLEVAEGSADSASQIHTFGAANLADAHAWDDSAFSRKLDPNAEGGTRCRIFHSKLNQGAIEFMVDAINTWLDQSEDIRIKHATSTLGVFEGKHADPNIILTLFY